ncbi:hypothetical protein DL96DRAFT_1587333 [Flagelloscypha sp. PMI_526]|nr:hypothetical protein DL96DRAFT_1587333 [Flagelloscypha sp. PMI_526]
MPPLVISLLLRSDQQETDLQWKSIVAFNIINIVGAVGIALIFLTALCARSLSRWKEWYLLLFMWFMTTISHLLLIGSQSVENPPIRWCLFQATMVYASHPSTALAAVAFVIREWLTVRSIVHKTSMKFLSTTTNHLLFISPFILWISIMIGLIMIASADISQIRRSPTGMYCYSSSSIPIGISLGLELLFLAIIIVFQVWVLIIVINRWKTARMSLRSNSKGITLATIIRLTCFALGLLFCVGLVVLSLTFESSEYESQLNVALASISVVVFVVFLQTDMLRVWFPCVCRNSKHRSPAILPLS